jgi:tetratricopeptide (TPR) repeat protein
MKELLFTPTPQKLRFSERCFSLFVDGKKLKKYKGKNPYNIAKKICSNLKNSIIKIELEETTKNSKKKVYGPYIGYYGKIKKKKMKGGEENEVMRKRLSNSLKNVNLSSYYKLRNFIDEKQLREHILDLPQNVIQEKRMLRRLSMKKLKNLYKSKRNKDNQEKYKPFKEKFDKGLKIFEEGKILFDEALKTKSKEKFDEAFKIFTICDEQYHIPDACEYIARYYISRDRYCKNGSEHYTTVDYIWSEKIISSIKKDDGKTLEYLLKAFQYIREIPNIYKEIYDIDNSRIRKLLWGLFRHSV